MARTANPDLAERRREQIMLAALACFRRRGFHQTSMTEICAEAQLSAGAVYRYFPSKTDIIAAISAKEGQSRREMFANVESGAQLIDVLVRSAEKFIARSVRQGDAPLMGDIMGEMLRDPSLAARMRAGFIPLHTQLAHLIAESQARGEFDPTLEPERAARWVFGIVDGVCMRAVMCRKDEHAEISGELRDLLERVLRPATKPKPHKSEARPRREKV